MIEKAKKLIQNTHSISILLPQDAQEDEIANALALYCSLKKAGKKVSIPASKPLLTKIKSSCVYKLLQPKNFIISIDASQKEISEIFYEKNEENLKICLNLSKGQIEEKDIEFSSFSFESSEPTEKPELFISLGAQNLEELESSFKKSTFDEIPILNITNRSKGEDFGQVNLKGSPSSLTQILSSTEDKNTNIALLTGLICFSLQGKTVIRPKTFATISYLIKKNTDIQKIIRHIKTRSTNAVQKISQLQLMGKVLKNLVYDENKEIYWAALANEDFKNAKADSSDLNFVITELKNSFLFPSLLIIWEDQLDTKGVFYSPKPGTIKTILKNFAGTLKGEGGIFLIKQSDLNSAKEKIFKILS